LERQVYLNNAVEKQGMSNKWLILLIMAFNGIMVILDMSIINISFPSLTRTFSTDSSTVLWVSVAYNLVSASMMPIWGKIGDMYGRKKLIVLGFIIFAVGLGLCAVSQTITQLIISRIIQAIGGSAHLALSMAIITATFLDKERGQALGVMTGVVTAGPLIGPTLGGFLLEVLDWRAIFYVRIPFVIIGVILSAIYLREQKKYTARTIIDWWGAVFLIIALSALTLFFNLGGTLGFSTLPVLSLAVATVLFLILFVFRESRFKFPLINLSLFKNRIYTGGNATMFIQNFTFSTILLLLPFLLIDGLGYSSVESGLFLTVPTIIMLFSPLSGGLSDRIGTKPLCITGIVVFTLGLFLSSRLNIDTRSFDVILCLAVVGLGNTLLMSPFNSTVLGSVSKENLGTAAAVFSTVRTMGLSSGMAFAGAIYASRQTWHTIQLTGIKNMEKLSLIAGYQDAALVMAIICAFGIVTAVVCFSKRPMQLRNHPKS